MAGAFTTTSFNSVAFSFMVMLQVWDIFKISFSTDSYPIDSAISLTFFEPV